MSGARMTGACTDRGEAARGQARGRHHVHRWRPGGRPGCSRSFDGGALMDLELYAGRDASFGSGCGSSSNAEIPDVDPRECAAGRACARGTEQVTGAAHPERAWAGRAALARSSGAGRIGRRCRSISGRTRCSQACVPPPLGFNANMVGPVIAQFANGSAEAPVPAGDGEFGYLVVPGVFSEPGAGSDLASAADVGGAGWRPLCGQWAEDVDDARAICRLDFLLGAHRSSTVKKQEGISVPADRHDARRGSRCGRSRRSMAGGRSTRFGSMTFGCRWKTSWLARKTRAGITRSSCLATSGRGLRGSGVSKARIRRIKQLAALERVGDRPPDRGAAFPGEAGRRSRWS